MIIQSLEQNGMFVHIRFCDIASLVGYIVLIFSTGTVGGGNFFALEWFNIHQEKLLHPQRPAVASPASDGTLKRDKLTHNTHARACMHVCMHAHIHTYTGNAKSLLLFWMQRSLSQDRRHRRWCFSEPLLLPPAEGDQAGRSPAGFHSACRLQQLQA